MKIMVFQWCDFLDIAQYLYSQGKMNTIPQEAAYRSAIGRAYYAAYCHSREYAISKLQFQPDMDDPVKDHTRLRIHLYKRGCPKEAKYLDDMRQWRNNCDYKNITFDASEITVTKSIEKAKNIASSLHL